MIKLNNVYLLSGKVRDKCKGLHHLNCCTFPSWVLSMSTCGLRPIDSLTQGLLAVCLCSLTLHNLQRMLFMTCLWFLGRHQTCSCNCPSKQVPRNAPDNFPNKPKIQLFTKQRGFFAVTHRTMFKESRRRYNSMSNSLTCCLFLFFTLLNLLRLVLWAAFVVCLGTELATAYATRITPDKIPNKPKIQFFT